MEPALWSFDLKDWDIVSMQNTSGWSSVEQDYVNQLFATSKTNYNNTDPPSMIVLGHDYRSSPDMVRMYVTNIRNRGYTFVDLDTCYNQWVQDNKPQAPCLPGNKLL